jgi:hypothetical protein
MKKTIFLFCYVLISKAALAGFADDIAKGMFQKKVDEIYSKAISCNPLEVDSKFKINVQDWVKSQPPLPEWQMLLDIEETSKEARKYAKRKSSNDKVQHCLAGCFIAKKLDFKSAVLVGWMKELSDASDCSKKTNFEKNDYLATVFGAKSASFEKECDKSCKK